MLEEGIGYVALAIAMASFMQNNIFVLRVMGIIASLLFLTQAIMIDKTSLIVANICFASIHVYWIIKYKLVDKSGK
ncbi:MAG: hypothetical protein DRQ60_07095 [Gammaproteobacteria bacterium]|nr:MAG: hypothetical protein DRQ60_07095 [Gammaproteobacteria bacterium]